MKSDWELRFIAIAYGLMGWAVTLAFTCVGFYLLRGELRLPSWSDAPFSLFWVACASAMGEWGIRWRRKALKENNFQIQLLDARKTRAIGLFIGIGLWLGCVLCTTFILFNLNVKPYVFHKWSLVPAPVCILGSILASESLLWWQRRYIRKLNG